MTNKAELIDAVAEATESSKAAAGEALDAVIDAITNALKRARKSAWSVSARSPSRPAPPARAATRRPARKSIFPASKNARFKPGASSRRRQQIQQGQVISLERGGLFFASATREAELRALVSRRPGNPKSRGAFWVVAEVFIPELARLARSFYNRIASVQAPAAGG